MFHEQCCIMQSAQGRLPDYSAVSGVRATAFVSTCRPMPFSGPLCTVCSCALYYSMILYLYQHLCVRRMKLLSMKGAYNIFDKADIEFWGWSGWWAALLQYWVLGTWFELRRQFCCCKFQLGSRHSGPLVRTSSLYYATICFVFPFLFSAFWDLHQAQQKRKRKQQRGEQWLRAGLLTDYILLCTRIEHPNTTGG